MEAPTFVFHHRFGPIHGWFSTAGLRLLLLPVKGKGTPRFRDCGQTDERAQTLRDALERFFSGRPETFADIPLDLEGATPFRRTVWEAARRVPWGDTRSYGELARLAGNPRAARAVGQALGANPIPILIPCHRFIAADGGLGGFGAGLDWKRELLQTEGVIDLCGPPW